MKAMEKTSDILSDYLSKVHMHTNLTKYIFKLHFLTRLSNPLFCKSPSKAEPVS